MRNPAPSEIRAARKDADLTQTEAAYLIYSTLRTWQDWEAGKARMHAGLWELFLSKINKIECKPPLAAGKMFSYLADYKMPTETWRENVVNVRNANINNPKVL